MGAIFWLAASLALTVYILVRRLPWFSPRNLMVGQLRQVSNKAQQHRPMSLLRARAAACWTWLYGRRRRALLLQAYPDLLAHLAVQSRAGAGILQAFVGLAPILREPLRSEVAELIADLRIAPFPAALERFALRCNLPQIRSFAQHVVYQQSLGIALPEVLESEEAHALALARQHLRRRIQATAITMAAVTAILLLNGMLIYLTPLLYHLSQLSKQG